LAVLAIKLSCD